jgi:branched-chain amino acid transport system substrate-binding protein
MNREATVNRKATMNRKASRGLAIATLAVLLCATVACTSGGGGTNPDTVAVVPGVTDTEIVFGAHVPLTGPAAAGYSRIYPAMKAYFEFVNSKDGVHGRKITYKYVDDGYNPATTQTVVKKLVLEDKVFAILNGLGTPTHTGVLDFLKQEKVPDLFVASGSLSWNQPTKYPGTFAFQVDYTSEAKILASYLKAAWPGKKTCHFGQNDDFGKGSLAGVEQVLGVDAVVAKQTYVTSNTDVTAQVGALKLAGCEVVVLATVPGFTALTLAKAATLGFKPQWVASGVGGDYNTVATSLGTAKGLLDGFITAGYLPTPSDTANSWNVLFKKINDEFNHGAPYDGNAIYGMSVGYLTVQVLQAAGKELTREGIIKAVEKGGYKGPGLTSMQYSATSHAGYGGVRLSKVTGGVQDYFGPVYTTDAQAGEVKEYTEPAAAPPVDGIPTGS